MKICPSCGGVGKVVDENQFTISVWRGMEKTKTVVLEELNRGGEDNQEVYEEGKRFIEFLRSHAHGRFYDAIKDNFK